MDKAVINNGNGWLGATDLGSRVLLLLVFTCCCMLKALSLTSWAFEEADRHAEASCLDDGGC